MVPCRYRTVPPRGVCLVPHKNLPQIECLCIIELVSKSIVEGSLSLVGRMLLLYGELKSAEHTPQHVKQRKRRAGNLSRLCGTPLVIFKLVISGSNMVEFTPNLVISFLA